MFIFFGDCIFTVEHDGIKDKFREMLENIKPCSRRIEVVYHTEDQKEILTRVYFPFDPEVGWA